MPRRRSTPSPMILSLGVTIWAVASIAAIFLMPIGVSVVYVMICGIVFVWWSRRVARRRADDLAGADDLLRPGDQQRSPDRPSGGVHGRHSWSRPE